MNDLKTRSTLEEIVKKQSAVRSETERIARSLRITLATPFEIVVDNVYRDLHIEDHSVERDRIEAALREGSNSLSS